MSKKQDDGFNYTEVLAHIIFNKFINSGIFQCTRDQIKMILKIVLIMEPSDELLDNLELKLSNLYKETESKEM
ncbi:MAG: hypothetical protein ACTSRU_21040 [Candidatus Hodarchaeales archaeon]